MISANELKDLITQLVKIKKDAQASDGRKEVKEAEIKKLNKEITSLENEIQEIKQENEKLRGLIANQTENLRCLVALEKENNDLKQQLLNISQIADESRDKHYQEKKSFQKQLGDLNDKYQSILKETENETIGKLKNKLETIQKKFTEKEEAYQRQVSEIENQIEIWKGEKEKEVREKKKEYEEVLKTKGRQWQKQHEEIVASANTYVEGISRKIESLKKEKDEKIEQLDKKKAALENEIQELKMSLEMAKQAIKEAKTSAGKSKHTSNMRPVNLINIDAIVTTGPKRKSIGTSNCRKKLKPSTTPYSEYMSEP